MLLQKGGHPNEDILRAILNIASETLAITRESVIVNQEVIEAQQRMEGVSLRMDLGISTLLRTTKMILGITQRIEAYQSGKIYQLFFDEWLIFYVFFLLHPFLPRMMEFVGSCMLFPLIYNRLLNPIRIPFSPYSYFTSPYKAIFLLYWFTYQFVINRDTAIPFSVQMPILESLTIDYEPTKFLIFFARWLFANTWKLIGSIVYAIAVSGFASRLNIYLLFECRIVRIFLGILQSFLFVVFKGVFSDVWRGLCLFEIPLPFFSSIKPLYFLCSQ